MIRKIYFLILILAFSLAFWACQTTTSYTEVSTTSASTLSTTTGIPSEGVLGIYILQSKTADGIDITGQYVENYVWVQQGNVISTVSITIAGLENASGTYEQEGNVLTATIGLKVVDYEVDLEEGTLFFSGRENRQDVIANYKKASDYIPGESEGEVEFTAELFGEDKSLYNFYNYCPSIMIEDGVMHIWYCSNSYSNYIVDYVAYRRGEQSADGKWTFTEKEIVLSPTEDSWDWRHVCDPSVIKGVFDYQEETYYYLMAYLGCVTDNNANNEVGIAVSKAPEGPWIKVDSINPIANYYTSPEFTNEVWTWGYGQPGLVSVDKHGEVLLFYTKGLATGTSTQVERWDLSDLDNPEKLNSAVVLSSGVRNMSGGNDIVNNADFAYDPVRKRIYAVKDMNPHPESEPRIISESVPVLYMNLGSEDTFVGETLFGGSYSWSMHDYITPDISGFARNHNPGLITDPYGWLISPNEIPVIYTVSVLSSEGGGRIGAWTSLHSYRLQGYVSVIGE